MSCLKSYGDASGQVINLQKSSIIFGTKVPEVSKQEFKDILSIQQEGGEGSYLGLPECFSGSKVKMLNFLKEKLQGRLREGNPFEICGFGASYLCNVLFQIA